MPVIVHPDNPRAEIMVGRRGHGTPIVYVLDRGNPKTEGVVKGRAEGNPRAVPADAHDTSFEISEDQAARK
jgi:hypothetical protein